MHTHLPRSAPCPLVAAGLLALPATALAATRYATPSPAGGANLRVGTRARCQQRAAKGIPSWIDSGNYVVAGAPTSLPRSRTSTSTARWASRAERSRSRRPDNVAGLTLNAGTRLAGVQADRDERSAGPRWT